MCLKRKGYVIKSIIYLFMIVLTKREGRTGRISALGLDSMCA